MNGANARQNVVEVVRLGAEPAVIQHQLTVEQNAQEKLSKRSLATPTSVQVIDLNSKSKYIMDFSTFDLFGFEVDGQHKSFVLALECFRSIDQADFI